MALTIPVYEIVEKSSNRLLGKHESWGRVLLGNVATVLNGFAFKSAEFSNSDGVPLIRIRDVGKDCSETTYLGDYDARYIVESGDLLVGMDGDFNCARWRGPRGLLNQRVCKITLKSDIYLPKFLDYTLPGYLKAINDVTSSVTVKHLSSNTIEEIPLPLPPIEVQQRLVAEIEKHFSRLDEAVANLKRVKANLKRYKAAVLKAAVEGKLTEDWRKQHPDVEPASKLLERILAERRAKWKGRGKYKEPAEMDASIRTSLPDGWLWASIESLSTKVVDGVHKKPNYVSSGVPFVTVRNLTAGPGINLVKLNYVTKEDHKQFIKRADPEEGDVLISKDGTLGVVRVIRTKAIFSIFVSVALVKPVLREMSDYLGVALSSPQVQVQMVPKGSGLQHIHLEDLRADCVPVPPLGEQKEIVAEVERRLSVIEELEAAVEANLTRADRLRQSILQQAFSGRLSSGNGCKQNSATRSEQVHARQCGMES